MSNNLDEQEWIEALGGRLHFVYRDVNCLNCIVEFSKERPFNGREFSCLVNYLYRVIYDRVYVEIYKILDTRKDVLSLKKFCLKIGCKKIWREIEGHGTFSKIRTKRHDRVAHDNRELALNQGKALTHHEDTKLHLSEVMEFLEFLKQKFEEAIATQGAPIFYYALGKEKEVKELKDLLLIAFSEGD